ncbi:MAG: branched-chain amino acid ABC transporter permease, partial [Cylindrospermopsis raciborskii PAMP2012]|nr:branched-chain amino acid ABC transporter permease [Cylindrospermopsis raciborskii PAMP2012]
EFTSHLVVAIILGLLSLAIYIAGVLGLYNYNPKAGLMLLVLLVLAFVFWRLEFLVQSPWGRVLKAIREDEEVPKALGKNVFSYKLQSLILGGAIAGIAGAFFAWQLSAIYPDNFQPQLTFDAWIMVILGGSGNNLGTILGAVIYFAYDALTREFLPKIVPLDAERIGAFRIMFIGLILMSLMIWRPQGILGKKEELTLGK